MTARNALFAVVSIASAAAFARPAMAVNVLTDPGFETKPLTTIGNVISSYPSYQNQWGNESGSIVGTTGAVSPSGGVKMLSMTDDGSFYSQCGQVVDVSGYAAGIDAGTAVLSMSALFNADLPAADASVAIHYVDSTAIHGNTTGPDIGSGNVTINSNPADWQSVGVSGIVPVGTRWIFVQVAYRDATISSTNGVVAAGFVDDAVADLRIVAPEPTTLTVAAAAGSLLARRRRRN